MICQVPYAWRTTSKKKREVPESPMNRGRHNELFHGPILCLTKEHSHDGKVVLGLISTKSKLPARRNNQQCLQEKNEKYSGKLVAFSRALTNFSCWCYEHDQAIMQLTMTLLKVIFLTQANIALSFKMSLSFPRAEPIFLFGTENLSTGRNEIFQTRYVHTKY